MRDPVAALLDHLGGVDGALPTALRQETRTAITELTLVLRAQGAQPDPDPWPAALREPLARMVAHAAVLSGEGLIYGSARRDRPIRICSCR